MAAVLAAGLGMRFPSAALAQGAVEVSRDYGKLPPQVTAMRNAILSAARTGDASQLKTPIEMNEIKPIFGDKASGDLIAHVKTMSADGNGREILAVMFNALVTSYAIVNKGTASEMYVWPSLAAGFETLTPEQEVELYRLVPVAEAKPMIAAKRYTHYAIGIGRDGVWHYFKRN
jgi:hypothetical protein